MPPELIDEDIPYIGGVVNNRGKYVSTCREAVKMRERGKRSYIKFVRDNINGVEGQQLYLNSIQPPADGKEGTA
jgi:hypothetical protein